MVCAATPTLRRSGLVLGFLATLADLPTAGPLLVATALLAGLNGWTQVAGLGLYNVVYTAPLVAIALAYGRGRRRADPGSGAGRRGLLAYAPGMAALCVAGAIIADEGFAALV